jgi:hypothetical protein
MDQFPVDFDVISRARLKMKICARFSIHRHAPGGDQLIRAATGCDTSRGEETIQTHFVFVEGLKSAASALQRFISFNGTN